VGGVRWLLPNAGGVLNPLVLWRRRIAVGDEITALAAHRRLRRWGLWNGHNRAVDKITGPGNAMSRLPSGGF